MVLVNYMRLFIVLFYASRTAGGIANFRILAPEIVCPRSENDVVEKPDYIVVTLQTEAVDLKFTWTVRWVTLSAPTQHFTLLLWRTVRALESQLNKLQPDPFAFIINNTQLLGGVDYIFNVTSSDSEDQNGTTRSFHIDNIKGNQKLIVEGHSDKFSVFLIGSVKIFSDMEYVLVAEVTTCSPIQDYSFSWNVEASGNIINVSEISGWRLHIPPYSLVVGEFYHVTCQVYRNSSLVTQTEMPFQVLHRGLRVYLNVDILFVTVDKAFSLDAIVGNLDYYEEVPMFEWSCIYLDKQCEDFESSETNSLFLPPGLPHVGRYEITVLVNVLDQHELAKAMVNVVEPILPVIQIQPRSRLLNEGSKISLVANASNVAPTCILTWYFATHEQLSSFHEEDCDECKHGEALSDSITIFSLEENFLNEITDYTNETEWRQVTVIMEALGGRARFVAECGCSLTFGCKTEGMVYADIIFELNPGPIAADIKISPEAGTAMETVFRISRLSASDPDKPILYTLLCSLGNGEVLVLGSNLEHLTVDTFLPYIDVAGTELWAEACDSLGACSKSNVTTVQLSAGTGRSKELLLEDMRGHVLRCESMLLNYIVRSTIVTYSNTGQKETLDEFTKDMLAVLPTEPDYCLNKQEDYSMMLDWLANRGVDITVLG